MIIKFEYKRITSKYNTDDGYWAKWSCRLNRKTVKFNNPEYIIRTVDKYKEAKKLLGMTLYTIDRETNTIKKVVISDLSVDDESDSIRDGVSFLDMNGNYIHDYEHHVEEKDIPLLQKEIEIEKRRLALTKEMSEASKESFDASVFRRFM